MKVTLGRYFEGDNPSLRESNGWTFQMGKVCGTIDLKGEDMANQELFAGAANVHL